MLSTEKQIRGILSNTIFSLCFGGFAEHKFQDMRVNTLFDHGNSIYP